MTRPATTIIQAAAAIDALGISLRPATLVIQSGRIVACDRPENIRAAAYADPHVIDLPHALVLPAMVNAHAHLDLTSLGAQPYGGDFLDWLKYVVSHRPTEPAAIAAAVHRGLALSHDAGVGWIGDIANSTHAVIARLEACPSPGMPQPSPDLPRASPGMPRPSPGMPRSGGLPGTHPTTPNPPAIPGVSYLEVFGLGRRQLDGFIRLTRGLDLLHHHPAAAHLGPTLHLGLQPHAPYSTGLALYNAIGRYAAERHMPISSHLAETPMENQFIRDATGPFTDLLRRLDRWDDAIVPNGVGSVEHLSPEFRRGGWLVAHANCVDDHDINALAYHHVSVAYCPIASEYFGLPGGYPHRYRDMLAAGVNVCLGTDSILCQHPDAAQPLSILAAMRRLHQRDRTDPMTLLRMATTHGMSALRFPRAWASLQPGAPARLITIDIDPRNDTPALVQALTNQSPAKPIL
ncbi:MAG: amidohydrolase family protein [Phycisphaeraceae bacterium]